MTDLSFSKNANGDYEATATVTKDWCLHLERQADGGLYIYQKAQGTNNYGACALPEHFKNRAGKVIDYDFSNGVYPKDIKIISRTNVLIGKIIE